MYGFVLNSPVNGYDADGRVSVLALIALRLLWEGACDGWALSKAIDYNPPNDVHEFKKHCYVGCLSGKCALGFNYTLFPAQLVHEIADSITKVGWNPKNWNWDEINKDTAATVIGQIEGLKLSLGDCAKNCDKTCLSSK